MNQKDLKKWWKCQNNTFSPNEFELMLKLYTSEHVNIWKDITWKSNYSSKISPLDSLFAKWMIERNMTCKLTGSWRTKMEEIEKLVEKNCFQRWLYKLNQYPVAVSLISSIVWAGIALFWQYLCK